MAPIARHSAGQLIEREISTHADRRITETADTYYMCCALDLGRR